MLKPLRHASRCTAIILGAAALVSLWPASQRAEGARPGKVESKVVEDFGIAEIKLINEKIREGWAGADLKPSRPATEGEWCRRVYLDIIGRIPSVTELNAFLNDRSPRKRLDLVSRLLNHQDYELEYARNWTTIWTNVLIGRTGGTDDRSLTNRQGMMQYLRRTMLRNVPYDRMVTDLITASGTTVPGGEDFNGATNFLVEKYEEKAAQATAKTSQVFLGLQVQCTQCHNHPFNDWKQNQFWEMNAFFRQSRPLRTFSQGRDIASVELIDESWEGEEGDPSNAILFYELRNGLLKAAYPVFVDGTSLVDLYGVEKGQSGYLEDLNRRQELAKMIVDSEFMPIAIVNRYWSHFLGYGFTKPIDDLGPHNPATHPELLDQLGGRFRANSFDLKQLILWITLSEPYSISSRTNRGNKKDDPTLGEKPMFSHFYLRQMRAEELYQSLLVATEAHKTGGDYAAQEESKQEWLRQFGIAFGTDEGDESTTFNGTIPQALMLMNGELIQAATSIDKGSFLARVARDPELSNTKKIERLYTAALARKPTSSEVSTANKFVQARKGHVGEALQDVWWVILNSNEFILQH